MTGDYVPEDNADYQIAILHDLQNMLQYHTKLPKDHPFIKLGMEVALKHAGYCAADIVVEENEAVRFTEEHIYLDTYARNAAQLLQLHLQTNDQNDSKTVSRSSQDFARMKPQLEEISKAAFREAVNYAKAVKAGELDCPTYEDEQAPGNYFLAQDTRRPNWTVTTSDAQIENIIYHGREKG